LLPLIGGCVSAEELRRQDEATCAGYGFHAGTNQFAECLQRESLARRYAVPPLPYGPYWGPAWGPYWPVPQRGLSTTCCVIRPAAGRRSADRDCRAGRGKPRAAGGSPRGWSGGRRR